VVRSVSIHGLAGNGGERKAIGAWQPLPRWPHLTSMWEAVPSGDLFLDALSVAYLNVIPGQ